MIQIPKILIVLVSGCPSKFGQIMHQTNIDQNTQLFSHTISFSYII